MRGLARVLCYPGPRTSAALWYSNLTACVVVYGLCYAFRACLSERLVFVFALVCMSWLYPES